MNAQGDQRKQLWAKNEIIVIAICHIEAHHSVDGREDQILSLAAVYSGQEAEHGKPTHGNVNCHQHRIHLGPCCDVKQERD